jgi:hypothetical protein
MPDGCGSMLDCGMCMGTEVCGSAGPNKCGGGACTPKTCTALGYNCGTASDGCGSTLNCGMCTTPETCGGAGAANHCGCKPKTCDSAGAKCGTLDDGCGGVIVCPNCPGIHVCDLVTHKCVKP